jgi:hypothetical protein
LRHAILAIGLLACAATAALAQGNYEVQVYGADLVPKDVTMVELHSNFTARAPRERTACSPPTTPSTKPWK